MDITPVLDPILALLRSRKFIVALATVIVNVLVVALPDLEPVQTELLAVVTVLASVLIGSIAYEDANK